MNKFAEKIQSLIDKNKVKKSCIDEYTLILQELDKYKSNLDEVFKIQGYGHAHYLTGETEEKILKLIEQDDSVLTIQNKDSKRNIGMIAARLGLENVVLRALDNEVASTQQDQFGFNIGMLSAKSCLEKCVLKALDNPIASVQLAKGSDTNIGMYSVIWGLEDAALKSLENKEASLQQDNEGMTIGMYVANKGYRKCALKAIENKDAVTMQDDYGRNIAMFCLNGGLDDCVLKILEEYPEISIQQDQDGYNLAMLSLTSSILNKDLILAAINDPMVLIQKTNFDHTLKDILTDNPNGFYYDDEEIMQKIKEVEESPEYITALNLANQDDEIIDLNKYEIDLGIV